MFLNMLFIAAIIILDQLVKFWAVMVLKPIHTIPLIDGVFHLTYAENFGAAFSIFEGKRWFFIAISVVLIIGIVFWLYSHRQSMYPMCRWALVMITGGAVGNLIDRIRFGFVVDMFDFRLINYPIFNIADCFVVIGTAVLCCYILFIDGKKVKSNGGGY